MRRTLFTVLAIVMLLCPAGTASAQAATPTPQHGAVLSYRYTKPASDEFTELSETLRESQILEIWTAYVNARLGGLPIKLEVTFAQCGDADSLYEPLQGVITLCYEEIHRSYLTLLSVGDEGDKLLVAWIGTMLGELYHELGHALIDKLLLPVTGRVEDAADQFAFLALIKHPRGAELALASTDYFQDLARLEKEAGPDPSQQHSLYSQRYFNMLCWVYGSDPAAYAFLVEQRRLPEARAKTCRMEYLRASYAWDALLAPYLK